MDGIPVDNMMENKQTHQTNTPHQSSSGHAPTFTSQANRTSNAESPATYQPEIDDIEDLPVHNRRRGSDSKVVRPYAIEEPEEDSTSESEGQNPPQQGQRKYWEDLVDSMQELHCDSDNSSPGTWSSMRGRKRKPATTPNVSQSNRHRKSASVPDAQYERPSLSPKRPRRKDEEPVPSQRDLRSTQKDHLQRVRGLSASSNTSFSTDTSGPNLTNGPPAAEAMDVD